MATRCKFVCSSITDHGKDHNGKKKRSVDMNAVYSADPNHENKAFWDASPGGNFKLSWINTNVDFEVGKEYYLDITEAPESVK